MRDLAPELIVYIELRTYVALYDLCIQQNNLNKAKEDIFEEYPQTNILTQKDLLKFVCRKRAERASTAWAADAFSRRMGIINGSTYTTTLNGITASRANPNFSKIINGVICEI